MVFMDQWKRKLNILPNPKAPKNTYIFDQQMFKKSEEKELLRNAFLMVIYSFVICADADS